MLSTDLALAQLETQYVALVALLVAKGVFTMDEYEAMVKVFEEAIRNPDADQG